MAALVSETPTKSKEDKNQSKAEACVQDEKESNESHHVTSKENDDNQLICFGGNNTNNTGTEEKLDGLTLDDFNGK